MIFVLEDSSAGKQSEQAYLENVVILARVDSVSEWYTSSMLNNEEKASTVKTSTLKTSTLDARALLYSGH